MTISVGVGGSWKKVQNIWVGVGGAWKRVTSLKVGVGGAWKESLDVVTLSGAIIGDADTAPGVSNASLAVRSDGTVDAITDTQGTVQLSSATDWIIPNASASGDYQVRATVTSGALTSGTVDTWTALSTDQTWTVTQVGTGTASATLTIEIRLGGVTQASGSYTLTAEVV